MYLRIIRLHLALISGVAACALALALPISTFAQSQEKPVPGISPNLPAVATVSREIRKKLHDSPTRITVELKGVPTQDALTSLLDATKLGYTFDAAFYTTNFGSTSLDLPPRSLFMKLVSAPIDKALDSVTTALGVGWTAEEENGMITIRIVKLQSTVSLSDLVRTQGGGFGGGGFGGSGVQGGFGGGGLGSQGSGFGGNGDLSALPGELVSIDMKDAVLRDVLKTVVPGHDVEYAVDDDVLATEHYSFTFKNVKFTTALDVICQSANIGWRVERLHNGKPLIRISRRYAQTNK